MIVYYLRPTSSYHLVLCRSQGVYSALWASPVHLQSALYTTLLVLYRPGNNLYYCVSNSCHLNHDFICNKSHKVCKCISYILISKVLISKCLVSPGIAIVADPPQGWIWLRFGRIPSVLLPTHSLGVLFPGSFNVSFHLSILLILLKGKC